jgi:hypothetical protein
LATNAKRELATSARRSPILGFDYSLGFGHLTLGFSARRILLLEFIPWPVSFAVAYEKLA